MRHQKSRQKGFESHSPNYLPKSHPTLLQEYQTVSGQCQGQGKARKLQHTSGMQGDSPHRQLAWQGVPHDMVQQQRQQQQQPAALATCIWYKQLM
jgi:hypothetical protein